MAGVTIREASALDAFYVEGNERSKPCRGRTWCALGSSIVRGKLIGALAIAWAIVTSAPACADGPQAGSFCPSDQLGKTAITTDATTVRCQADEQGDSRWVVDTSSPAISPSPLFDAAPLISTTVFDDFNGPAGSAPNSAFWLLDTINQGGIQVYDPKNAFLDGQGHLVLRATKDGENYYSGRVTSRTKFNTQYGRVSASIKMPSGQGFHTGFWLLGLKSNGYPETDIIETINTPTAWYSTLHTTHTTNSTPAYARGPADDLSTAFHEYWLEWHQDSIVIGMDQTAWASWTPAMLPAGETWTFNAPMYVIMNLQVGGSWSGPPDASTPFPGDMSIDWFRYTPSPS
jgi:beta-glucanase (GH16 family)